MAFGQPPEEHQQGGIGDRVAVQDPGQVFERGGLEVPCDVGRPTLTMNRSRLASTIPTQTIASTWFGEARGRPALARGERAAVTSIGAANAAWATLVSLCMLTCLNEENVT